MWDVGWPDPKGPQHLPWRTEIKTTKKGHSPFMNRVMSKNNALVQYWGQSIIYARLDEWCVYYVWRTWCNAKKNRNKSVSCKSDNNNAGQVKERPACSAPPICIRIRQLFSSSRGENSCCCRPCSATRCNINAWGGQSQFHVLSNSKSFLCSGTLLTAPCGSCVLHHILCLYKYAHTHTYINIAWAVASLRWQIQLYLGREENMSQASFSFNKYCRCDQLCPCGLCTNSQIIYQAFLFKLTDTVRWTRWMKCNIFN